MKRENKKKNPSVSWIFFGYCSLIVLIMLVVVWVLRLVFVDNTYKQVRTAIAERSANELVEIINNGGHFDQIAKDIVANTDTSIVLLDGSGMMVAEYTGEYKLYPLTHDELLELRTLAIQSAKGSYLKEVESDSKNDILIYAKNVEIRGAIDGVGHANIGTGTLVLSCHIAPMAPTIKTINYELLIITAIMLVLGAVSALLIARHISKPIVDINEKSSRLARGDYGVEFSEEGYKEVSELASTLNYATRELGKSDRMRRDLIANVSHDLRTPLTMIRGYAEMMRDMPSENNAENMNVIIKETDYLTKLVKDMLDMSKLEANVTHFNLTTFDMNALILDIVERYNNMYRQQGFAFEYEPLDGEVFVHSDAVMITTVIYNLINNAVNHVVDDKNIVVKAVIENGIVNVHVIDHGEGIEQSKLETIWDRYYKAERNLKRESAGSGLGLSIVKTVITRLGGTYGVTSVFGEGSDFSIGLPITSAEL